ncbi:pyocin activator PrtN family protein [Suttonella ornithocola]|uniref:Pyocin activator protein PrtN n=1 Tax=Suttonella ornithocola TaxID=279832 RepID=A0A380RC95_9GAMM|nr:pyocin activator PrtN family protein [Suttonella ornithocola]SUO95184.1 Pyocin activator protein PrtN [Suttonella ornithocola]SUQ09754.1 Pyocin activator protein PrtN [Suttonella ornithocola]
MKIDTATALLIKYQTPTPLLTEVAQQYFPHIAERELKGRAARQDLPFPVFKIDKSKKAPYYVHLSALAAWIDKQQKAAENDFSAFS